MRCDGGLGSTNEQAGRPQPHAAAQHVERGSAASRWLVQLLLGHALVDAARRPYGWCCEWCHPPDHLQPDQVRWEPAPEATGPLL